MRKKLLQYRVIFIFFIISQDFELPPVLRNIHEHRSLDFQMCENVQRQIFKPNKKINFLLQIIIYVFRFNYYKMSSFLEEYLI